MEFRYKYVDKIPEPEVAADARLGKAIHAALEAALGGMGLGEALKRGRKDLVHDEEQARFDELSVAVSKFAERIEGFRARRRVQRELVEHRLAVDASFMPTGFNSRDAFFRGVWDVGFVYDNGALAVVDHKTGARRALAEYADQLQGYATLAAAHLAQVKKFWLGVHFVVDAAVEWSEPMLPENVRSVLIPRAMEQIEQAARLVSEGYGPRPSGWCKRCSYRSICPETRDGGEATPTSLAQ